MAEGRQIQRPALAPGLYADRYELIDAWRGVAALAVCIQHVTLALVGGPAVMLFFVISGYCIAASADSCERRGWGFKGFMGRRVHRIYPPYLFSLAFRTVLLKILKYGHIGGVHVVGPRGFLPSPPGSRWVVWLQNLTLTQWMSLLWQHPRASYAANNSTLFVGAYWSLCYEEQFYLVIALMVLVAGRARVSVLAMSTVLMGVALIWNVVWPTTSFGLFIEYWSLFAMGILVFHRLCRIQSVLQRRTIDVGLALVFAASAYVRWLAGVHWPEVTDPTAELRIVYRELAIAAFFALVLIATRPSSERVASLRVYRPLAALGHITFSLYLIHQVNVTLLQTIAFKMLRPFNGLPMPEARVSGEWSWPLRWLWPWFGLQLAGHIALASVFWYFCERPFLNRPVIISKADSPGHVREMARSPRSG
jgi:peptidoglycan/LPS O-acetylase OafA/YrhL